MGIDRGNSRCQQICKTFPLPVRGAFVLSVESSCDYFWWQLHVNMSLDVVKHEWFKPVSFHTSHLQLVVEIGMSASYSFPETTYHGTYFVFRIIYFWRKFFVLVFCYHENILFIYPEYPNQFRIASKRFSLCRTFFPGNLTVCILCLS